VVGEAVTIVWEKLEDGIITSRLLSTWDDLGGRKKKEIRDKK
jgi:hypothetical protein